MRISSTTVVLSSILLAPATSIGTDTRTVEQIRECVEANSPAVSSAQTVLMRTVDRAGETTETRARILWRRPKGEKGRVLLRVIDPQTRRGTALLMVERDDMDADFHLYLPEMRKTRRVAKKSLQGSMFGTDLSYEDFRQLQWLTEDTTLRREADSTIDGKNVYTLIAEPKKGSGYERLVTYVDQERCLILRSEYYEGAEQPRKVVSTIEEKVTKESFGWLPRQIRVEDLDEATHTDLIIEEFDASADISESDLSIAQLEKSAR